MKRFDLSQNYIIRREFCAFLIMAGTSALLSGCSIFKGKEKKEAAADFEVDDEYDEEDSSERKVFDSERDKESETSEFLAKHGRGSNEKKKIAAGDTFLLSDKAKEIYANTER